MSFYLYLRKEALRKNAENPGIDLPYGLRLAKESSLEEYFCNQNCSTAMFINNHYNNFYSYYLATGSYDGYQQITKTDLAQRELLSLACMSSSLLSNIYFIDDLGCLSQAMLERYGFKDEALKKINQIFIIKESSKNEIQLSVNISKNEWQKLRYILARC